MAFYKNKASQKIGVYAYDEVVGAAKTGDAANITGQISKDYAAASATNDTNPTELDSTNFPGVYVFDMTQTETNADAIILKAKSSTANVVFEPVIIHTQPETRAANVTQIGGDTQSATDLKDFADAGYDPATHKVAGVVTTDTATALGAAYDAAKTAASQTSVNDLPTNAEAQAMFDALNQSASRRVTLSTSAQYERPESGSSTYTVEVRTYDGDGAAADATGTPTVTPTGIVSGSLAANLGAGSNPATGVYRYIYTVEDDATLEQIQMAVSAVMSDGTFTIAAYPQVCDFVAATFTTADRATLEAAATQASVDALNDLDSTAVQTAAAAAITAYDPPTNTEFEARTLAAASYATAANQDTIAADALLARKLIEADRYFDKTVTPWQVVWIEKGTGTPTLADGTELLRQDLFDVDGADLTAVTTPIGQTIEAS